MCSGHWSSGSWGRQLAYVSSSAFAMGKPVEHLEPLLLVGGQFLACNDGGNKYCDDDDDDDDDDDENYQTPQK